MRHVVEIARGVAVVADGFWPAKKGREALEIDWDDGPLATLDSRTQREEYAALAKQPGAVARRKATWLAALGKAAKKFEAVYELPYLAHATMEPINCVADVRADRCEVWTGTQFQTVDRDAAAQEAGLKPEQVKLHTTLLGGGFGRRAVPTATSCARRCRFPKPSRRRSRSCGRAKTTRAAATTGRGPITRSAAAWMRRATRGLAARIVCQSFIAGTPFEAAIIKDGVDDTAVEGAADIPYDIPNLLVDWHQAPTACPPCGGGRSAIRTPPSSSRRFVDELAHAAGKDPCEFRRALLGKHPRYKARP